MLFCRVIGCAALATMRFLREPPGDSALAACSSRENARISRSRFRALCVSPSLQFFDGGNSRCFDLSRSAIGGSTRVSVRRNQKPILPFLRLMDGEVPGTCSARYVPRFPIQKRPAGNSTKWIVDQTKWDAAIRSAVCCEICVATPDGAATAKALLSVPSVSAPGREPRRDRSPKTRP